ncbi:MAG: hypothetical protein IPG61_08265 [bacterium]|nr:hypothetical protein [bacterium]
MVRMISLLFIATSMFCLCSASAASRAHTRDLHILIAMEPGVLSLRDADDPVALELRGALERSATFSRARFWRYFRYGAIAGTIGLMLLPIRAGKRNRADYAGVAQVRGDQPFPYQESQSGVVVPGIVSPSA